MSVCIVCQAPARVHRMCCPSCDFWGFGSLPEALLFEALYQITNPGLQTRQDWLRGTWGLLLTGGVEDGFGFEIGRF